MTKIFDAIPFDAPKRFSLCDAKIDEIICGADSIRFCFHNGFFRVEGEEICLSKNAFIEFNNCNADDFTCHIFKQIATKKGAELHGMPVALEELACMLSTKKRKVEIYLELYDFNFMYWRGVLLPYNPDGLSDRIDIEASGDLSLTYFWE